MSKSIQFSLFIRRKQLVKLAQLAQLVEEPRLIPDPHFHIQIRTLRTRKRPSGGVVIALNRYKASSSCASKSGSRFLSDTFCYKVSVEFCFWDLELWPSFFLALFLLCRSILWQILPPVIEARMRQSIHIERTKGIIWSNFDARSCNEDISVCYPRSPCYT
jgi:hypothetical protein